MKEENEREEKICGNCNATKEENERKKEKLKISFCGNYNAMKPAIIFYS